MRLHLPLLGSWRSLEHLSFLRSQLVANRFAFNAAVSAVPWRQGLQLLPQVDVVGLNAAMALCRWQKAHALLVELPHRQLEATVVSRAVATKASADAAQWRTALSGEGEWRSQVDGLGKQGKGLKRQKYYASIRMYIRYIMIYIM